jgi:hypothetical protein
MRIVAGHWWLMLIVLATQEDHGSKASQKNSPQDPMSKIHNPEKGWWSGVKP